MKTVNDTIGTADKVTRCMPHSCGSFGHFCHFGSKGWRQRNNRVYSLECDNSRNVAKFYFRNPADKRDRLKAEFESFSFLWAQGIKGIPRPIAFNDEESCAIYEFIEGKKIVSGDAREEDVKYAVDFVTNLKRLNKIAVSHNIPPASDACFSIQAVIANVEGRLDRFGKLKSDEPEYRELGSFLMDDFKPFFSV